MWNQIHDSYKFTQDTIIVTNDSNSSNDSNDRHLAIKRNAELTNLAQRVGIAKHLCATTLSASDFSVFLIRTGTP